MNPQLGTLLAKLTTAFKDVIELPSGYKIYTVEGVHREENVTAVGVVKYDNTDLGLKEGDTIAFHYHVVATMKLDGTGTTVHQNQHLINGEFLWKIEDEQVFAVKVNNEWKSCGDWVLLKPYKKTNDLGFGTFTEEERRAVDVTMFEDVVQEGQGIFISGKMDAEKGDLVYFNEELRAMYSIEDEDYIILKTRNIIANYNK